MNEDDKATIFCYSFIKDIAKKDNVECCVCMETLLGVKLPNCNHFICPLCYDKLYYGYVSDKFFNNNPRPIYPEKPTYPYLDITQNLEIYNHLTEDKAYMDWFINENEDLYNCIKLKEYVDNINSNLIKWFENNELIIKYKNDLLQYEVNYKKYCVEINTYLKLLEKEKENNIRDSCPLCRL